MDPKMTAVDAAEVLGVTTQAIVKKIKTKKLQHSKSQNRIYFGHETAKEIFSSAIKIPLESQIVTFEIVKGGVGKTTIVSSLATRASLYGLKVLCIDTDPQGNLTQAFNQNPANDPVLIDIIKEGVPLSDTILPVCPGIDLLPSRIENSMLDNVLMLQSTPLDRAYKPIFDHFRQDYDLILVDCPPSLGQSVAATAAASDLVIAPVAPESFCLSGLSIIVKEFERLKKSFQRKNDFPLKILLNKYDSRTKLSHEVLKMLLNSPTYQNKMFQCYIRTSQEFANTAADRESVFDVIKPTPAKEDIDIFTRQLINFVPTNLSDGEISLSTNQSELISSL